MDVSDQKTTVYLPVPLLAYLLGRMIDDTTLIESIVDTEIVALRLCHEIRRLLHKTWVRRVKATKDTKVRLLSRFIFSLFPFCFCTRAHLFSIGETSHRTTVRTTYQR